MGIKPGDRKAHDGQTQKEENLARLILSRGIRESPAKAKATGTIPQRILGPKIKAVEVHHLDPGIDEIPRKFFLGIVGRVDLRNRPQFGV